MNIPIKILIAIAFALLFSSCSVTNYVLKKTNRQYVELGLSEWTDVQDSSTVHWRKVGSGDKNLLLFHGFGPATEMQWKDIVMLLHEDFTIYIPDLIYFGKSTSKFENYDPRFITRQTIKSLKKQFDGDVYVAGVSFGGLISSLFANQYPTHTKGLILIDVLSRYSSSVHTDSLAQKYGYDKIDDILIPKDGKALHTLFKLSYYKPKNYPSWTLNKASQKLYENQRREKERLLDFLKDNEPKLKTIQYPFTGAVHIIWGREDLIIPLSNAYQLRDYYPNSSLTILPETGHVANLEAPEEVAKQIKAITFN